MSDLRIECRTNKGGAILRLTGAIGIDDMADLDREVERLICAAPPVVAVDLSGLAVISSIGMSALVRLHRGLKNAGGCVRIVSPTSDVFGALDKARIFELMPVFGTVDLALATAD